MKPSVMIGVTTFNRPEYLRKSLRAINAHVASLCDAVFVHNDGSDKKFHAEYQRAYTRLPAAIIQDSPVNEGVAKSKNALLQAMFDAGADWLFLCEDDILVQSPEAITGYIAATESSGFQHLAYAHHGPANLNVPDTDGPVSYFPHSVGAWCIFSRECIEDVGLFNENFVNAWEHVEHTMRLIQAGYCLDSSAFHFPDASGSQAWLAEIKGSIEHSSIRPLPNWRSNIHDGLVYWRDNYPETFEPMFGEESPLHAYGLSITG